MTRRPPLPDARTLLHHAVVYGYVTSNYGDESGLRGFTGCRTILVVGCHRPHIPCGTDPAHVNAECARRFAVWLDSDGEPRIVEVAPEDVVAFVDVDAMLRAADVRVNAAQVTNQRKEEP